MIILSYDGRLRRGIASKPLANFTNGPLYHSGVNKDLLQPGDWLTKVDLKDAYFTIPMHPDHRKYLRFSALGKVFQFTCLPFGLSSAPWVFTKVLKPIAALARELGWRIVVYIDDILLMAETKDRARDHTMGLIRILQALGFTINNEKVILEPTQRLDFLGFTVDTNSMELRLPNEKLKNIRAEARKIRGAEPVSGRTVARLIGKMNATTQVIPPAPLFYRHLQRDLSRALDESQQNYDTRLILSQDSREELEWWNSKLQNWNGKSLMKRKVDLIIQGRRSH